ncbi:hypothetical protein [Candidatus Protochlamydia phocaeensis]|uniref:hypothetical protein n=1 Tax=Candidatus Protochlamydia phocaeensis TaxID=1414722 RepID=UPI0008395152|nr:hypothetical protein [Candidatus Protochlamydia phocaeensis]
MVDISSNIQHTAFVESLKETLEDAAIDEQTLDANAAEAAQEKLAMEEQENASTGMMAPTKRMQAPPRSEKIEKAKEVQESVLVRKDEADQFAGDFSRRQGNREYHLEMALLSILAQDLGVNLTAKMSSDDIIKHVYDRLASVDPKTQKIAHPDSSQVDKAFEFLLEVTSKKLEKAQGSEKERLQTLVDHIKVAKQLHFERNETAIRSAQQIIEVASGVIDGSGLTPKETLDRMRDILNNPQDVQAKRKFYEANGGYSKLIEDAKGFYHLIGENLKRVKINIEGQKASNMPVLENAELTRLNDETKTLQAATRVPLAAKNHVRVIERFLSKLGFIQLF